MSRIDQINELIKQELAKIILEELEFDPGVFATIMNVETSDSLETANVWVSIFPEGNTGSTLETLNKNIGLIQSILNKRIALRFVPRIAFKIDKSQSYASEIEKVFKKIDEKNEVE